MMLHRAYNVATVTSYLFQHPFFCLLNDTEGHAMTVWSSALIRKIQERVSAITQPKQEQALLFPGRISPQVTVE